MSATPSYLPEECPLELPRSKKTKNWILWVQGFPKKYEEGEIICRARYRHRWKLRILPFKKKSHLSPWSPPFPSVFKELLTYRSSFSPTTAQPDLRPDFLIGTYSSEISNSWPILVFHFPISLLETMTSAGRMVLFTCCSACSGAVRFFADE